MKMVVKVNGGLGNQLFQYAMGRALALRTGAELLLDLRFFALSGAHTPRAFELDLFRAHYEAADETTLARFDPPKPASRFLRMWKRAFPASDAPSRFAERGFPYDPAVLQLKGAAYIDGYWQSERYFTDHERTIREDLTFRPALSAMSEALLQQIHDEPNAASLHVRRGDYVNHPQASAFHGLCEPAYYAAAMQLLYESTPPSRYFVFSDDIAWARENLAFGAPVTFVDHNSGNDSWQDMRLMMACRHHVIANSSFSWWGAWLNPFEQKRVVAPKRWFLDPSIDTRDLIPASWTRL